jgi:hypothetical protein
MEQKGNAGLELVAVAGKPLSVAGVEQFKKALDDSLNALVLNKATPENASICEKAVAAFNKAIKNYKAQADFIRTEYYKPIDDALAPIDAAIADAQAKGKTYANDVLLAKKAAYKATAFKTFCLATAALPAGSAPDFDAFYESKWYDESSEQLGNDIIAKLQAQTAAAKDDPTAHATFEVRGSLAIAKAEEALKNAGVAYEKK